MPLDHTKNNVLLVLYIAFVPRRAWFSQDMPLLGTCVCVYVLHNYSHFLYVLHCCSESVTIEPPVPDMNIREFQVGQTLTVPCSICTCQEIEAVELFKGNQLIFPQPVAVDRVSSLCSVHRFELQLSDDSAGSYACSVTIAETSVSQVFTIIG